MIWKFRVDETHPWSYIFGTMHTWDKDILHQFSFVSKYISLTDHFYTEINLDESLTNSALQQTLFSGEKCLSTSFGAKKTKRIRNILLKSFDVDIMQYDHMLPLMIVNYISLSIFNNDASLSMDHELWEFAKSKNKILRGLESIEYQVTVLNAIPWDHQAKQLIDISKNVKKYSQFVRKLIVLYKNEDILGLLNLTAKSLGQYKHIMLRDRNYNMSRTILLNKEKSSFYAVGAAHLAGFHGILRLLKNGGFKVLPVGMNP